MHIVNIIITSNIKQRIYAKCLNWISRLFMCIYHLSKQVKRIDIFPYHVLFQLRLRLSVCTLRLNKRIYFRGVQFLLQSLLLAFIEISIEYNTERRYYLNDKWWQYNITSIWNDDNITMRYKHYEPERRVTRKNNRHTYNHLFMLFSLLFILNLNIIC